VILGKVEHRAKWNSKALPPAANKHTFVQMHLFPIFPLFQALCHVFISRCLGTYSCQPSL